MFRSEPKETNRQIGPFFRRWLQKGTIGLPLLAYKDFVLSESDAILDGGDAEQTLFAQQNLNYQRNKGLDLIIRFRGNYIIGEAKFLTDFGGHQNAQFHDAMTTLTTPNVHAIQIAVLDGVLYIKSNNKLFTEITQTYSEHNIMSALVLRDFIYQL